MKASPVARNMGGRLREALVDLLYRQSRAVLFANLIIPWPVAYVLGEAVPGHKLLIWIGAIYALTGARLLLSHRYFRRVDDRVDAVAWARRFTLLSILSSLLWGAIGWIGFLPEQPHLIAFVCIVLTGMSGGAVPALSAYPPAYAGLLIAMQLPFALRCLSQEGSIYSIYLAFVLCLVCVYLYYSLITYRSLRETVALRFENLALVGSLERERDRATAADQAKTRFLAAASHDLRQPIHALGLFTASLAALARRGDIRAAEARGIADKLQAVIAALGGLLHGLIDVSRLDAGLVPVERRPISLSRLIAGLREEFAPQAQERGVELRAVASDGWVDSDPVLLKRILDNLLSNALRHAPGARVLLGCRRRGDVIEIQVVDAGPGIPAEQREAVFEEFTQLHNPQRDRDQGLGLGLAIVRRLANLLGHSVELQSNPGKGSVFSASLPRAAPPAASRDAPMERASGGLGIMVVDDDALVLDGLTALLAAWGYRAYAAASVDELCRRHDQAGRPRVHMILADYRLVGGMTGAEAIARLAAHLGYGVPALIVTGDTSPERLRELAATGHVLLHKPLAPALLRAAIRQAMKEPALADSAG